MFERGIRAARTWDVDALVLDTDGVHTHLLGHKLDAVVSVAEVDHVTDVRHARGAGHRSLHVVRAGA